ncbi:molybdopterin-dependent oxidoreductase, partial [Mycobacterium tuberculosis]|nr:molybdopterin-dependent oxidoreductase [Mycobacterium tuberculosis]
HVDYASEKGRFDLEEACGWAEKPKKESEPDTAVGDFAGAFAAAPVQLDARYTTPDQSHSMMEPHASMAAWDGDKVTIWTSN